MNKKESVNNKFNELNAIATFGQTAKVGGLDVTPATAKSILDFYETLKTKDLKNQFLLFDAKQMKNIALGTATQNQTGPSVQLTPEAKFLVNIGKKSLSGLGILWKKNVTPLFEKSNKKNEEDVRKL